MSHKNFFLPKPHNYKNKKQQSQTNNQPNKNNTHRGVTVNINQKKQKKN